MDKIIYNSFLVFIFLTLMLSNAEARTSISKKDKRPIIVDTSFYLTRLYDVSLTQKQFKIVGYMRWIVKPATAAYLPYERTEIINAKEEKWQRDIIPNTSIGHYEAKVMATIDEEWNLRNFPFDQHQLKICFEDMGLSENELRYVADQQHSSVRSDIYLDDWEIIGSSFATTTNNYINWDSTKASENPYSKYSQLVFTLKIKRHSAGWLFFYLFVGSFVAAILCILSFFTRTDSDVRFNLFLGAVFAVVSNQYLLYNLVPMTPYLALGDKIQIATFILLILTVTSDIILRRITEKRQRKTGQQANNWMAFSLCFSYVFYVVYVVRLAVIS